MAPYSPSDTTNRYFPETFFIEAAEARFESVRGLFDSLLPQAGASNAPAGPRVSQPSVAPVSAECVLTHGSGSTRPVTAPVNDLILTGFCGETGADILAEHFEELLLTRFPKPFLLSDPLTEEKLLAAKKAAAVFADRGLSYVTAGNGGAFGALYAFSKTILPGFTVDLKALPIKQKTIEILDFLGGDPYECWSFGQVLCAVPPEKTSEVLTALKEAGVQAKVIGKTRTDKKKILLRGETERFLSRPHKQFILEKEYRKNY